MPSSSFLLILIYVISVSYIPPRLVEALGQPNVVVGHIGLKPFPSPYFKRFTCFIMIDYPDSLLIISHTIDTPLYRPAIVLKPGTP